MDQLIRMNRKTLLLTLVINLSLIAVINGQDREDFHDNRNKEGTVVALIGASGGVIRSADGSLAITVPAGAIDKEYRFSITPGQNTNPAGLGMEYDIVPHTINFKKPVTIQFSYAHLLDSISLSCGLRVAFKDSSGRWKTRGGLYHDQQKKTLIVQSTHFSRWCVMESVKIIPHYSLIHPSDKIKIQVIGYVPNFTDPCVPDNAPTPDVDISISTGQTLPAERIKQWTLVSPFGKLTPNGGSAYYQAPSTPPQKNTITVMAEIKSLNYPLLSTIDIVNESAGVMIQVGYGAVVNYPKVSATKDGDTYTVQIFDADGTSPGYITWTGKIPGTFSWKGEDSEQYNHFSYTPSFLDYTVESYYEQEGKSFDSHGELKVRRGGKAGELLIGEFTIKDAGKINRINGDGTYEGETIVMGSFRVILDGR